MKPEHFRKIEQNICDYCEHRKFINMEHACTLHEFCLKNIEVCEWVCDDFKDE